MKMKGVILLLVVLGIIGLSCTSTETQVRTPGEYQGIIYNATSVNPKTEGEVLDFLVWDKTDRNVWIAGEYMCQEFACDLWWNAYNEGIEACLVAVYRGSQGHWVVKFHTIDGWLWVEPHTDITSDECWYEVYGTACDKDAFDGCVDVWDTYWLLKEDELTPMVDVGF